MRDTSVREGEENVPVSQAGEDAVEKKYAQPCCISRRIANGTTRSARRTEPTIEVGRVA
jgi:hypothetical protein